MTDQLWAIVSKRGGWRQIYTSGPDISPADAGHRDECKGKAVWPLAREPDLANGEVVDFDTGAIMFNPAHQQPGMEAAAARVIADIKAEAARRIEAFAPIWRQMNDMRLPETLAAKDRAARIDAIRAWSDVLEARAAGATSASVLRNIRAELAP